MKPNWKLWSLASCMLMATGAFAQGGPAGMGPGEGMGQGAQRAGGMCCSSSDTMGWGMMSRQERTEHRNKIRSMKTYEECKAYVDQHHTQMTDRAKEKGRSVPAQPRVDACAWLKKK